jgi:hypothetical protein
VPVVVAAVLMVLAAVLVLRGAATARLLAFGAPLLHVVGGSAGVRRSE